MARININSIDLDEPVQSFETFQRIKPKPKQPNDNKLKLSYKDKGNRFDRTNVDINI